MSLGVEQYREMAERIDAVALELKRGDGPRFIRPWRLNNHSGRKRRS